MHTPLWVEEVLFPDGTSGFATDGTPVDCVRLAALGFLDHPPELIVSGINLSGNLGDDITYSGTVAAAFEGIMLAIPALAVSADDYHEGYDLSVPARVVARLVRLMLTHGFPAKTLLNVNCPDVSWERLGGMRLTSLGKRIYGDKVELRESDGNRHRYFIYGDALGYHREAGTDFEAMAEGWVSVTPLHFDLMSREALPMLREWDLDLRETTGGDIPFDACAGADADLAVSVMAGADVDLAASGYREPLDPAPLTVVFDLDGTVVDSVELIVRSFDHAARTVLGLELPRGRLIEHVGRPLREQMALLDEAHADELVIVYREYNQREHDRMLRLFPGMAELLLRLRARNVRLGLVTSKSRATTEMAFRLTGIDRLFDATVCAGETLKHKPYPEPLLRCLELLDAATAARAVYVGDAPYDLQAAQAAGMAAVAVSWGVFPSETLAAEQPQRLVRTVDELATVLGLGTHE
jgi:5'-nucleotidase